MSVEKKRDHWGMAISVPSSKIGQPWLLAIAASELHNAVCMYYIYKPKQVIPRKGGCLGLLFYNLSIHFGYITHSTHTPTHHDIMIGTAAAAAQPTQAVAGSNQTTGSSSGDVVSETHNTLCIH